MNVLGNNTCFSIIIEYSYVLEDSRRRAHTQESDPPATPGTAVAPLLRASSHVGANITNHSERMTTSLDLKAPWCV